MLALKHLAEVCQLRLRHALAEPLLGQQRLHFNMQPRHEDVVKTQKALIRIAMQAPEPMLTWARPRCIETRRGA